MTTTDAEPAILRRNILLRISYDGTRFHGWQKQLQHGKESFRTVQGEIERALALLHKHPVELFGSGRTDAGVHACGQAAHFFTDIARMKPESFIPALNSALPKDVRIQCPLPYISVFYSLRENRFCASITLLLAHTARTGY